jgi:hypothetical protein
MKTIKSFFQFTQVFLLIKLTKTITLIDVKISPKMFIVPLHLDLKHCKILLNGSDGPLRRIILSDCSQSFL